MKQTEEKPSTNHTCNVNYRFLIGMFCKKKILALGVELFGDFYRKKNFDSLDHFMVPKYPNINGIINLRVVKLKS